jgi:ADP-glucose pyrophosphorylase
MATHADDTSEGSDHTWIGSTGIYLFKKSALEQLLGSNPRARDFSRDLIPDAIRKGMKVRRV